ncbi:leucyl/phenylalanyl-tRNA--protein transferase [Candidatus Leptofilum sp.]|uniref:leucyl/phenylalanyl-tRNA--protein transferase n=1 Tax=Candidatus Leptofilum sp. TaxID=3241576 RepID=UPI003B59CF0F
MCPGAIADVWVVQSGKNLVDSFLSPQVLLSAYCQGVFPMAYEDGRIFWYDPDPRAIIPLDHFHVSRSLRRTIHKQQFEIRIDSAFTAVIEACAAPAPDREDTWISEEIMQAYIRLHRLGFAHSVEAWQGNALVGGLYGVAIGGFFAGESMFSKVRDSSKVALAFLVAHLNERQYSLLDIQFMTEHLRTFGAVEIPATMYKLKLGRALLLPTTFR